MIRNWCGAFTANWFVGNGEWNGREFWLDGGTKEGGNWCGVLLDMDEAAANREEQQTQVLRTAVPDNGMHPSIHTREWRFPGLFTTPFIGLRGAFIPRSATVNDSFAILWVSVLMFPESTSSNIYKRCYAKTFIILRYGLVFIIYLTAHFFKVKVLHPARPLIVFS